MGKKSNYFRHSLNAHMDWKMQELLSKRNGLAIYGFFFILCELYGRALIEDDNKSPIQTFRVSLIAKICNLRADSVRKMLTTCTEVDLLNTLYTTKCETICKLEIPNYSKYFGSYSKKNVVKSKSNTLIKEKKRKEKEIKENTSSNYPPHVDFNWVQQTYNDHIAQAHNLKYSKMLSGLQMEKVKDILIGRFNTKDHWNTIFKKIKESKKLLGQDKNYPYQFNPSWLCDEDKLVRIFNGEYDDLLTEEDQKSKESDQDMDQHRKELCKKYGIDERLI